MQKDYAGQQFHRFEVLKDGSWTPADMEDIVKGDWFRYVVPRDHDNWGLMYEASCDAYEDPDDEGAYLVRAARAKVDETRLTLH